MCLGPLAAGEIVGDQRRVARLRWAEAAAARRHDAHDVATPQLVDALGLEPPRLALRVEHEGARAAFAAALGALDRETLTVAVAREHGLVGQHLDLAGER